jgi:hypothetical protein
LNITDVDVSSDGAMLAISGGALVGNSGLLRPNRSDAREARRNVWVFSIPRLKLLFEMDMEPQPGGNSPELLHVVSIAFSPNGKQLAAFASDATINVWEMGQGKRIAAMQSRVMAAAATSREEICWLADSRRIVETRPNDFGFFCWELGAKEPTTLRWRGLPAQGGGRQRRMNRLVNPRGEPGDLTSMAIAPNGAFLVGDLRDRRMPGRNNATVAESSLVFVDLKTREAIGAIPTGAQITAIRVSPDSTKIAVGTSDAVGTSNCTVRIFSPDQLRELVLRESENAVQQAGNAPPQSGRPRRRRRPYLSGVDQKLLEHPFQPQSAARLHEAQQPIEIEIRETIPASRNP